MNKCASCKVGFTLNNAWECVEAQCRCNNGVGAKGKKCVNKKYHCKTCNDEYYLSQSNQCKRNKCICTRGNAVKDCPKNGLHRCETCNHGYGLNMRLICVKFSTWDECDVNYHGTTCNVGQATETTVDNAAKKEGKICGPKKNLSQDPDATVNERSNTRTRRMVLTSPSTRNDSSFCKAG